MNRLTVFFIIIWGAAFVMLSINSLVLTCKWAPMKKGKVPKKSFIKKSHRIVLWISLIVAYLAMILFCFFLDSDRATKIRIFGIILLLPLHPLVLFEIASYCFLFNRDREYRKLELTNDEANEKE